MTNDVNETCMMNVDANVDDLKYYVGTSYILEYINPPIPPSHLYSLTMSNFDAYMHSLKKFQRWPPFTTHYVGSLHDICDGCIGSSMSNFKIVMTTIL